MPTFRSLISSGAPISSQRFEGEDLSELILSSLDVTDCEFHDCEFRETTIRASRFLKCRFSRCSFVEARFEDVKFAGPEEGSASSFAFSKLDEATFKGCNLNLVVVRKCSAIRTVFEDCSATGLKFDATVQRALRGKRATAGVTFRACKLLYAVFQEKDLEASVFDQSDLRDVDVRRANLAHASFRGANLVNVDWTGATLDGAVLCDAAFDDFPLASLRSFHGMTVSRDQQAALLAAIGILVGS